MKYFCGVDVAKETFDFRVCDAEKRSVMHGKRHPALVPGFERLLKDLRGLGCPLDQVGLIIEASGNLHENLAWYVAEKASDLLVYVVNPFLVKKYGTAQLHDNETDAEMARRLAEFLVDRRRDLHCWVPNPSLRELSRLRSERDRVELELASEINRLRSHLHVAFPEFVQVFKDPSTPLALVVLGKYPIAKSFAGVQIRSLAKLHPAYKKAHHLGEKRAEMLKKLARVSAGNGQSQADGEITVMIVERLKMLHKQVTALERMMEEYVSSLARENKDKTAAPEATPSSAADSSWIARHIELLRGLPGIGEICSLAIVTRAGFVPAYKDAGAFSAMLGGCPRHKRSGKSINLSQLTPHAHRKTRAVLFVGVRNVIKTFAPLNFYYTKAREDGKKHRQAICMCLNRLLHWAYAVVTTNTPFDPKRIERNCAREFPQRWQRHRNRQNLEEVAVS